MSDIKKRAKHHLQHGTGASQTEIIRELLAECERMEAQLDQARIQAARECYQIADRWGADFVSNRIKQHFGIKGEGA